jgi:hypothetical protein
LTPSEKLYHSSKQGFRKKTDKVENIRNVNTGDWKVLHNDELHSFCSSCNVVNAVTFPKGEAAGVRSWLLTSV